MYSVKITFNDNTTAEFYQITKIGFQLKCNVNFIENDEIIGYMFPFNKNLIFVSNNSSTLVSGGNIKYLNINEKK